MKKIEKIKVMLDEGAWMPERAHEADAGYDLMSPVEGFVKAHGSWTVDTGVHVQIPEGYVGFLKSKSGLNVKCDLVSEGVIDSGYTGSIVVKLYNHGNYTKQISEGQKITQLVILPIATPELEEVDKKTALSDAIEAVSYHSAALEQKWTPCCQRCGERVTLTDRYCRKCGQKLPPFNWEGL